MLKGIKNAVIYGVLGSVTAVVLAMFLVMSACQSAIISSSHSRQSGGGGTGDLELDLPGLPPWVTIEIVAPALELQESHGIYASVTIAQAQQEVGGTWDGTSLYPTASVDFNLFGLKAFGNRSTWGTEVTWDGSRGATGTYRKYESYRQGLRDRARLLLTSPTYANVAATAFHSSRRQLEALSRSPWCENQYSTLERYMDIYNLWRLDAMTLEQLQRGDGGNDEESSSELQRRIAEIARTGQGTRPCRSGYCAAWVSGVYEAAGLGYPGGNAIDYWNRWKASGSTSMRNIPVGAAVLSSGSGRDGAVYGHIGIYIGDGKVANNIGYLSIVTVEEFANAGTATCQGHRGWIGWVYPYGRAF
ncbi:glucosaminidase domain-containing protein [Roseburia hominis]